MRFDPPSTGAGVLALREHPNVTTSDRRLQKKGLHCRKRVALASCAYTRYSFQSSKQTLKGVFCPRRHTLSGSSPDWLRELLLPLSRVPPLVHGHWTGAKAFSCVLTTPESRLLFENNVCDHFYQYFEPRWETSRDAKLECSRCRSVRPEGVSCKNRPRKRVCEQKLRLQVLRQSVRVLMALDIRLAYFPQVSLRNSHNLTNNTTSLEKWTLLKKSLSVFRIG